ncbi:MAG: hypothetical protein MZV63_33400 [Marinilabiliales bacterium]|nr:hypothetical protein [Marinilabiliales bacterium]
MSIDLPPPAPIRNPAPISRASLLCAIHLFQLGGAADEGLGLDSQHPPAAQRWLFPPHPGYAGR